MMACVRVAVDLEMKGTLTGPHIQGNNAESSSQKGYTQIEEK
jgi:hypothetical protein